MFYEIESVNGEKITISCSDDGAVIYTVGKRKTTFSLAECSEYIFSSCDGTSQRIVCGEYGVDQLTLIMLHGEERLERNNDERETRRHESLSDMPDKYDEMADKSVNVETDALRNIDAEDLRKAIRQLKPSEQELIQRLYLDRHPITQAEYARQLGVTENTIQLRAAKIRKKLKSVLL